MKKKIFIQLFLFSLFLFLSIFSYNKYFKKESQNVIEVKQDTDLKKKNNETNLITNLKYFSIDKRGNKYEITSEYGEMDTSNSDVIMMENVKAIIEIYNSDPIIITSNFAKYNVKNYDTNFKENILVKHVDNKLNGENLDLSFQNNLMSMYNNSYQLILILKRGYTLKGSQYSLQTSSRSKPVHAPKQFTLLQLTLVPVVIISSNYHPE